MRDCQSGAGQRQAGRLEAAGAGVGLGRCPRPGAGPGFPAEQPQRGHFPVFTGGAPAQHTERDAPAVSPLASFTPGPRLNPCGDSAGKRQADGKKLCCCFGYKVVTSESCST